MQAHELIKIERVCAVRDSNNDFFLIIFIKVIKLKRIFIPNLVNLKGGGNNDVGRSINLGTYGCLLINNGGKGEKGKKELRAATVMNLGWG